jgi:hypothetical protein
MNTAAHWVNWPPRAKKSLPDAGNDFEIEERSFARFGHIDSGIESNGKSHGISGVRATARGCGTTTGTSEALA